MGAPLSYVTVMLIAILGINYSEGYGWFPWTLSGCKPSFKGKYPSVVSLEANGEPFCTGVIIHDEGILTSKDCAISHPFDTMYVSIGNKSPTVAKLHRVIAVYEHPNETRDIAVLKVKPRIPFDECTNTAQLPDGKAEAETGHGYFLGWGSKVNLNASSTKLTKRQVEIINTDQCEDAFYELDLEMSPSYLCVLSDKPKGTCARDNGAPIFQSGTLVGIAGKALVDLCASQFLAENISFSVDWIQETGECIQCSERVSNFSVIHKVRSYWQPKEMSFIGHDNSDEEVSYPVKEGAKNKWFKAPLNPTTTSVRDVVRSLNDPVEEHYPFLVQIIDNGLIKCVGSILNEYTIVTAGQCIEYARNVESKVKVLLSMQETRVTDWRKADGYMGKPKLLNDIGILKVEDAIKFENGVRKMTLPKAFEEPSHEAEVIAVGLNEIDENKPVGVKLLKLKITDGNPRISKAINKRRLYAFAEDLNTADMKDITVTSGAPLMWGNKVIGVTSAGIEQLEVGHSGIFTKISHYIRWIEDTAKALSPTKHPRAYLW